MWANTHTETHLLTLSSPRKLLITQRKLQSSIPAPSPTHTLPSFAAQLLLNLINCLFQNQSCCKATEQPTLSLW